MKSRQIVVTARDGERRTADLIVCDNCPQDPDIPPLFIVFQVQGTFAHPHLQCAICGTTFCCGDCENEWTS